MKQQFTYALDEARIRKQLQDLSPGNADAAWQKFSMYADAQPRQVTVRKMPALKLKVDRRIMVPAAAAIVIIVLAVLLFNFVDFNKKASKSSAQKSVVAEPFVPMPQVSEAETILPPLEKREPAEPLFEENNKALAASKPEVVKEKSENPVVPGTNDKSQPVMAAVAKPKSESVSETQTTQTEPRKKKREPAEEMAPLTLPDIRPNLLTEEEVDDIRPN